MVLAPHPVDAAPAPGETIRVRGLVQGVGFRPTVWRLARDCGLTGEVSNDAEGVLIHVWGAAAARRRFIQRLHSEAPPLARIDSLESTPLTPQPGVPEPGDFRICASTSGAVHTGIVADAATCGACCADVLDADNRRHQYAFTNCTHCGPRLSIVRAIPYDRANTSMAAFEMCAACAGEYANPADRRFHAQPNACPDCGPRLWLEGGRDSGPGTRDSKDPISAAQRLLRAGRIVAIKGIGGIHLACDATNAQTVARLRQRKRRPHKPLALMARDESMIRRYCSLTRTQTDLLRGAAAPIVLLDADGAQRLPEAIAPRQHCYGFMLPYSPLHHLLMAGLDGPIVLTSGNRCDEPQCIDNQQARDALADIADVLLLHNRDIVNRVDDSVVRMLAGSPALLRRARGYAPKPLPLPAGFAAAPDILAFGGELKNTFCLLKDGQAIVSQHLGDLENAAANTAYRDTLVLYQQLFAHQPRLLAIDSHPEYLPSKLGRELAEADGAELLTVQHHHAHIAACLADNHCDIDTGPVLGIALDGTGFGDDATLWGGEFLLADYCNYRRLATLAPLPMPGGAQAIHQPWRMAYAHLQQWFDWDALAARYAGLPFFQALRDKPLAVLAGMIKSGFNAPETSSCGRLFDAVAAVTGLRQTVSYEGQAAIELEASANRATSSTINPYPFAITQARGLLRLNPQPMWRALLDDLHHDVGTDIVAARFHAGLAQAITQMVEQLSTRHGNPWHGRIALSGGVFQNAVFTESLIARMQSRGLQVLRHRHVPANDGGLSLGQAAVAAARTIQSETNPINSHPSGSH